MKKAVTGFLLGCLLLSGSAALAAEPAGAAGKAENVKESAAKETLQDHAVVKSRGTMVYVPMDTRPVCKDYTVATMKAAGWDVLVPPEELLSSADRDGQPDKLLEWLEQNTPKAVAVVASADALIYGGLVDSRTHHIEPSVLQSRVERLLSLKKKVHSPDIYVFVTIMRSPKASAAPVEPVYYQEWGGKLFRHGALRDKVELQGLSRKENKELQELNRTIPRNVIADYYDRRRTNIRTSELLLHGIESDSFNYLLVGRDDTSPCPRLTGKPATCLPW